MRARKFRRRFSGTSTTHPLPKTWCFPRIISCQSHVAQPDGVRFALVVPRKGKQKSVLCTRSKRTEDHLALTIVHVGRRKIYAGHDGVRGLLLEDSFAAVAQCRMRHL